MHAYHNSKPKMSRVREEKTCHGHWPFSEIVPQNAPPRMGRKNTNPNTTDDKREKGGGSVNWMELLGLSGFEDFEQVELTELKQLEQKNRSRVLRTGRRMVAAVLATAMILPAALNLTTIVTNAVGEKIGQPQVERLNGISPEDPTIQIESNFVHDEFGFLTGTLELAIRVKSPIVPRTDASGNPVIDGNGDPIMDPRPLQAVSVNLAYNTKVLHPVGWNWAKDADPDNAYDVDTNVDRYYTAKLETQKSSKIETAAATTGIVADPASKGYTLNSQAVKDGDQGLLYFTARAFKGKAFTATDPTTIAVIRFAVVDDDLMKNIQITKAGDGYKVNYIGAGFDKKDNPIGTVKALKDAMAATATATSSTDPVLPLVEFAQQKDIENIEDVSDKPVVMEPTLLYYSDEYTGMNYIPDYYSTLAAGNPATELVTRPVDDKDYTLDRPNTAQSPRKPADWSEETLTLARKETAGTPPTVDYSYTTNLIHDSNIEFTVVSKESFMAGNDDSNLTTIVYVDWDNTIMGTQIVPKNHDIRRLVSDHVAENFVHEDLRNPTDVTSLKRTDSYRGRYPHSGYTSGNTTEIITNGEKWPLTYKLDYTFFKRQMEKPGKPDPADPKYDAAQGGNPTLYDTDLAAWRASDTWEQAKDAAGNADTTEVAEYPFAYGWAECTLKNYENMWTTMASGSTEDRGEFSNYSINPTTNVASVTYTGTGNFTFADLESGVTEDTVVLKAVYEAGDELERISTNYYAAGPVYYGQYGFVASNAPGTAYVVRFQYERVTTPDEYGRGVVRTREPTGRITFYPLVMLTDEVTGDVSTQIGNPFYMLVPVDNVDVIDVEVNPAAEIYSIGYYLTDEYGENYVTGAERTDANENVLNVYSNFDLDNFNYSNDGNHRGSEGTVVEGTLRHLLEVGVEAVKPNGSTNNLTQMVTGATAMQLIHDINFRTKNNAGATVEFTNDLQLYDAYDRLLKLFEAAYQFGGEDGVLDLDWHQIQYHLLTCNTDGTGGAILGSSIKSAVACIQDAPGGQHKYEWCKLHGDKDCAGADSGTALPITNWAQLLDAAYAYGNTATPNSKAMDNLTPTNAHNLFSLATDADGSWADTTAIADLRTKIKDAVYAANTAASDNNAYKNLTWGQVQYYILNGAYPANMTDADTTAEENYWWVTNQTNGQQGKKGGATVAELLTAVDRATDATFTTPDGKTHANGWTANLKTITADMDKVTNAPLKLRESDDAKPDDGKAFADAAAFEDAIKKVVNAAKAADAANWANGDNLGDWDTLQYNLIHYGTTNTYAPKTATVTTEAEDNYWWKYGNEVTDWVTMMEAADATQDHGTELASDPTGQLLSKMDLSLLTQTTFDAGKVGIWLRKDEIGNPVTDKDAFITVLKNAAADLAAAGKTMKDDMTWEVLQYMLDKGVDYATASAAADVSDQAKHHYWWNNGDDGVTTYAELLAAAKTAYGTDGTDGEKAQLSSILYNGLPVDMSKDFQGNLYTNGTYVEGTTPAAVLAERQSLYTQLDGLVAAAKTAGYDPDTAITAAALPWASVQYYLLHDSVGDTLTVDAESQGNTGRNGYYWWSPDAASWGTVGNPVADVSDTPAATGGSFDPNSNNAINMLGELLFRGEINANANAWNNAAGAFSTDGTSSNMRLISGFQNGKTGPSDATADADLTFATQSDVQTAFATLATNVVPDWKSDNALSGLSSGAGYRASNKRVTLDWFTYQYALLHSGALPGPAEYTAITDASGTDYYWWLEKSDKSASEGNITDAVLNGMEASFAFCDPYGYMGDYSEIPDSAIDGLGFAVMDYDDVTLLPADGDSAAIAIAKEKLATAVLMCWAAPALHGLDRGVDVANGQLNLTWYQIQWIVSRPYIGIWDYDDFDDDNGTGLQDYTGDPLVPTPAQAYTEVMAMGVTIPAKVAALGTSGPGVDELPDNRDRSGAGAGISVASASIVSAPKKAMQVTQSASAAVSNEAQVSAEAQVPEETIEVRENADGSTTTITTTYTPSPVSGRYHQHLAYHTEKEAELNGDTVILVSDRTVHRVWNAKLNDYVEHSTMETLSIKQPEQVVTEETAAEAAPAQEDQTTNTTTTTTTTTTGSDTDRVDVVVPEQKEEAEEKEETTPVPDTSQKNEPDETVTDTDSPATDQTTEPTETNETVTDTDAAQETTKADNVPEAAASDPDPGDQPDTVTNLDISPGGPEPIPQRARLRSDPVWWGSLPGRLISPKQAEPIKIFGIIPQRGNGRYSI